MSIESNEEAMLTAFARLASKAQEIEALLQEIDNAAEVATDTKNRSFEEIAAEIEKLPLGPLKEKFLKVAQITDPLFPKMWKEINEERIFLMHQFFKVFPLPLNADGLRKASQRIAEIDKLLDIGQRLLREVRDRAFAQFNITPEFLKFVTKHRRKAKAAE